MSSLKTQIELAEVEEFLRKNVSADIENVEMLKGGEISQAFSIEDNSKSYIIKIRRVRKRFRKKDPFGKEISVAEILKKQDIQVPIPNIIKYGIFKEVESEKFIFCIVEKASGKFVHLFPKEKFSLIDRSLIDVLYQIHSVDISSTKGYGNWNKLNEAPLGSMRDHILDVIERQKIYTNNKFSEGIFEIDLYLQGSTRIKELVKFCSTKRYLVHADYGYDNVLADEDGNITAVYDWEHSLFGDFVYDIAWLDFWRFRDENTYSQLYYEKYKDSNKIDFKNYKERLLCYKLYIGMTAAGFFSESNQKDKYLEAKQLILELLQN